MIGRRRLRLAALLAIGLALAASGFVPGLLRERFLARARSIPVGATHEDVIQRLGAPNECYARGEQFADALAKATLVLWFIVPESPETWAYGRFFAARILGPEEDDVLVEFDERGLVSRVVIPGEGENE